MGEVPEGKGERVTGKGRQGGKGREGREGTPEVV